MTLLTLATVLGLLATVLVAWQVGGVVGAGILAGFLVGAAITMLGLLHQRHTMLHRPADGLRALVTAFLAKLVVLMLGAVAIRYIEPVAARLDWRGFLVAFAAAVVILLPVGTLDAVRGLKKREAH